MTRLLPLAILLFLSSFVQAQLLSWSPPFPVQDDPAQKLVITLDATKGNAGLLNHSPVTDVYVHIGVITSKSTGAGDWKYVKFQWGTTNPAAQAVSVGANQWQYTINGSLKAFFGITDAAENIQKIALLFRSGNGNKKHTNSDGSDLFIPVYDNSLAVRLTQPASEPRFVPVPEPQNWTKGTAFTVEAASNQPASLKLYHNSTLIGSATNALTVSATSTVTTEGNQQIVAEATTGSTTRYDTLNIFVAPTTTPVAELPAGVRDGINYEPGDTSVTLVLFAPGKNSVLVLGDFNNWSDDLKYIMNKTPDGQRFWLRLTGLTPGTEYGYQYKVDNNLKVADYYAEKMLDPWNDAYISNATYPNLKPYPTGKTTGMVSVLQTRKPVYNWAINNFNRPDKRSLVVYELLLRDFLAQANWNTLTDTLRYFKRLGINALELLPFNEFEGNNSWGYNPAFYFAPDKAYGPANSLKRFIDSAHAHGLAVIMDIALNHSFGQSPMVQLYANPEGWPTADNPWFNPDQNATAPGYQGKHPFGVGYDFNHESAATKYFTSRVVEHWLREYKLDGFRFDLSKGFTQNYSGDDAGAWSAYDASRVAIWKAYYDTVQTKSPNAYVILEHLSENSEEKELAAAGMLFWGNMSHNYQEAAMGWLQNSNFSGGLHTVRTWSQPHLVTYMESHDEERIVFKNKNYGNASGSYNIKDPNTALERMELAAAFLFTQPGPKMLWQFGEWGYDYSINRCEDGTIKDECRTAPKPIGWQLTGDAARKEVFDTYSRLIHLRFHPLYKEAFIGGSMEHKLDGGFKWQQLLTDTSKLMIVGNFDVNPVSGTVTFPSAGTWYNLFDSSLFTATGGAQTLSLQPGAYQVWTNRNILNVKPQPVDTTPVVTVFEAAAYPNPATAAFTLKIRNPESGNVSVRLYDALGRHVANLQEGVLAKGEHRWVFERHQLRVQAGMYYLKVVFGTERKTLHILFQ